MWARWPCGARKIAHSKLKGSRHRRYQSLGFPAITLAATRERAISEVATRVKKAFKTIDAWRGRVISINMGSEGDSEKSENRGSHVGPCHHCGPSFYAHIVCRGVGRFVMDSARCIVHVLIQYYTRKIHKIFEIGHHPGSSVIVRNERGNNPKKVRGHNASR